MPNNNEELYKNDKLYQKVTKSSEWFEKEAKKHKRLNRQLWLASSIISILVAITTAIDFSLFNAIKSQLIATILAIILPVVTAYIVLRTPEKLWILETSIRNRLRSLGTELEFQIERDINYDRGEFEKEYIAIMNESSEKWVEIKQTAG